MREEAVKRAARTAAAALLLAALILTLGPAPLPAFGDGGHTAVLRIDSPRCVLDGRLDAVDPGDPEMAPVIREERTLLPIRRLIEHFGGSVEWDGVLREVSCYLNGRLAVLTLDYITAVVDGRTVTLDAPARIIGDRTFVPVRFVSESLGLHVAWDGTYRLVGIAAYPLSGALTELPGVRELLEADAEAALPPAPLLPAQTEAVVWQKAAYSLPSGKVRAYVVSADLRRVRVEARLVDGVLNRTAFFYSIATRSGADAVVNANFFNAYEEYRSPIGSLVSNGLFLYSEHGLTGMGITPDGRVVWGSSCYLLIDTPGGDMRFDHVNRPGLSELYSSAWGPDVTAPADGHALILSGNVIQNYCPVTAGEKIAIPRDGYVCFREGLYWPWDPAECTVYLETEAGDVPVTQLVSGNPLLVQNGELYSELAPGFDGHRFTDGSAARTLAGVTEDGCLILAASAGTVQQMRELMLSLGCVTAFNLDGGSSSALYCGGEIQRDAGRELTSTLQIFAVG